MVQWVVKVSKLCNLRCKYCYEWPWLSDARRMELDDLDVFFGHVADYYKDKKSQQMEFVWHGGEPLLIEQEYYEKLFELQHRHFDPQGIAFGNSIQTNLFLVRPGIIEFLREGFSNVGVSVDLFGDLRVDVAGRAAQTRVLENVQKLIEAGVRFGCITVLSKATAPRVREIFEFFKEISVSFRLLPIYRTGYEHQQDRLGLSDSEIVDAFKLATDLWLDMEEQLQVRPIEDYVRNVIRKYLVRDCASNRYQRQKGEILFIVDTDGGLYSNADAYSLAHCYGNVFRSPLAELLQSSGYSKTIEESEQRLQETCAGCPYFGPCSGFFMAEATPEQRFVDQSGRLKCGVALPVQTYIERRLAEIGVLDPVSRSIRNDWLRSIDFRQNVVEAAEF